MNETIAAYQAAAHAWTVEAIRSGVMVAILAAVCVSIVWFLHRRDKDNRSRVSLDTLLVDADGIMNREWSLVYATWIICAWFFLYKTMTGGADTGMMLAFSGVFAAPVLAKLLDVMLSRLKGTRSGDPPASPVAGPTVNVERATMVSPTSAPSSKPQPVEIVNPAPVPVDIVNPSEPPK